MAITISSGSSTVVSVRSHGAKGDGVTNDTPAFQAAVDRLASMNPAGGFLCIPKGTYLLDRTQEWYAVKFGEGSYTVRGDGMGLSKILTSDNQGSAFHFGLTGDDDPSEILIEHLAFATGDDDADDGVTPAGPKGSLLSIAGLADQFYNRVFIKNCLFKCPARTGVHLQNIRLGYIQSCVFLSDSPAQHISAVKPASGVWDLFIRDCVFQDCDEEVTASLISSALGAGAGSVDVHDDASSSLSEGPTFFGSGDPNGVKTAAGRAVYIDYTGPGIWHHNTTATSNTNWIPIVS